MSTCKESFKKKNTLLTSQAFLSNNLFSSIEKNVDKNKIENQKICRKFKLDNDHLPKIDVSKSQNNSDTENKFTYTNNTNSDSYNKRHSKQKRFKV